MTPSVKIKFYLTGDHVELESITQELGLKPTDTRKKEEWPQGSIRAGIAKDSWQLVIQREACRAVSDQLDRLQSLLLPKADSIRALIRKYSLESTVIIVVNMEVGEGPELVLTKENVQFLSQIEAEIGFDMYIDYPEEEDSCDELEY